MLQLVRLARRSEEGSTPLQLAWPEMERDDEDSCEDAAEPTEDLSIWLADVMTEFQQHYYLGTAFHLRSPVQPVPNPAKLKAVMGGCPFGQGAGFVALHALGRAALRAFVASSLYRQHSGAPALRLQQHFHGMLEEVRLGTLLEKSNVLAFAPDEKTDMPSG